MSPAQTLLERHRQQFPALANKAYFNYGGQGPMPVDALQAIQQSYEEVERAGPFSQAVNDWNDRQSLATRQAIAGELGVPVETIALTEDVTVGCNIALWGLDWKPGEHLLITDCEHPGVVATVGELQRRLGIEVSTCPLMATLNEGDPVEVIARHLRPNTRLVVLSHILWNTGQVLPLAEIVQACRNVTTNGQPVRVLADAAQSVGVLPLNLTELGVDFYAFTGHKWWCGPEGVGGLYVRPDALESLHPTFIGWRGIVANQTGQPAGWKPDARRFEIATSAYPLYAGLRSAIEAHHQWGTPQERYQRILHLSEYLWQKLGNLPGITCLRTSPPEAGLVSFQLDKNRRDAGVTHKQLVQFLENQSIMVRTIVSPDCVRACAHYFTVEWEIDRLVAAISDFIL
ncbi:MAG: aminotransferase class V-fold PLP-dependent enzyme [Oscillatoria princeps RMCB-10]|jgi:L-cysteine/cystine lyase|nr:aminotransferase class V-fold PLP-dependent enzyme [Oscillatoria princeps RMCB-10]